MTTNVLKLDAMRYGKTRIGGGMRLFQYFFRRYQAIHGWRKKIYFVLFKVTARLSHNDIAEDASIGPGLYCGHPYCITIGGGTKIGRNFCIHKGATIGMANRGVRKGIPTIGDDVWVGINATVVGKITIGDDVLIAPNSYVNIDIPSHSIVLGNPCIVKHRDNATAGYIVRKV